MQGKGDAKLYGDDFEDQFIALLAPLGVVQNQPSSSLGGTSAKKRARELKWLDWSVRDGMGERSSNQEGL